MTKKKSSSKAKAARQQKRKYPFTKRTRLYDVTKTSFHPVLVEWLEHISPNLEGGEVPNWKTVRYLHFKCGSTEAGKCIASLLVELGEEGLKDGWSWSTFFRYIASEEHSNLHIKPSSLNTLVHRQIGYYFPEFKRKKSCSTKKEK